MRILLNGVDHEPEITRRTFVKYLKEDKACLEEDSEITAKERRLLNRIRESLGISEERANEIKKR